MLKKAHMFFFVGLLMALNIQAVRADDEALPSTAIKMSTIIQDLQKKGYNTISKIEYEDGFYEAKVLNSNGEEIKLHINPTTGEILRPKGIHPSTSMLDIVRKIEKAGYHDIYKIECKPKKCEIKALSKEGKKTELKVDPKTGVIREESDD